MDLVSQLSPATQETVSTTIELRGQNHFSESTKSRQKIIQLIHYISKTYHKTKTDYHCVFL